MQVAVTTSCSAKTATMTSRVIRATTSSTASQVTTRSAAAAATTPSAAAAATTTAKATRVTTTSAVTRVTTTITVARARTMSTAVTTMVATAAAVAVAATATTDHTRHTRSRPAKRRRENPWRRLGAPTKVLDSCPTCSCGRHRSAGRDRSGRDVTVARRDVGDVRGLTARETSSLGSRSVVVEGEDAVEEAAGIVPADV